MTRDEAKARLDVFTQAVMAITSRETAVGVAYDEPVRLVLREVVVTEAHIVTDAVMAEGQRLQILVSGTVQRPPVPAAKGDWT